MLVIAHRGANREALENSWTAFERAIEGGAARIELDVQLTADGHAAVLHDDMLERTTGVRGRISAMTRDELARVKLHNGDQIPFLDEVVERLLPRVELNIEIKGRSEELARVVGDLVLSAARREAVIVSSFNEEPLVWLKRNRSEVRRACLLGHNTFTWPYFAIFAPSVFLEKAGTNVLHPEACMVNENMMDQARARGWIVNAWVPLAGEEQGREGLWAALKTVGLDGLCTNYPRQLRSWLTEAALDEHEYRPD